MSNLSPDLAKSCMGTMYLAVEGTIDGWCQYQDSPDERVTVELLVNGDVVRAMRATRLRLDRRDIGMGDGYCGFSFPFPPAPEGDDDLVVLEVREKRSATLIGRVVLGNKISNMISRLDAIAVTLSTVGSALAASPASKSAVVEATGALGLTLLQLAGLPSERRTLGPPGLEAALAQTADIPARTLPRHPAPKFSLVVRANHPVDELAGQLVAMADVLAGLGVEFLLLDDGTVPAAALLPTRLRNLTLVPVHAMDALGPTLNAAAEVARGKFLVFGGLRGPDLGNLRRMLTSALRGQVSIWQGASVQCMVSRDDFAALGGFEPCLCEQAMWESFAAKALALNCRIVPRDTDRSDRARWV